MSLSEVLCVTQMRWQMSSRWVNIYELKLNIWRPWQQIEGKLDQDVLLNFWQTSQWNERVQGQDQKLFQSNFYLMHKFENVGIFVQLQMEVNRWLNNPIRNGSNMYISWVAVSPECAFITVLSHTFHPSRDPTQPWGWGNIPYRWHIQDS